MEDVDDVVVVLEAFEEAAHVFLLVWGEFAEGEGYALEFEGLDF